MRKELFNACVYKSHKLYLYNRLQAVYCHAYGCADNAGLRKRRIKYPVREFFHKALGYSKDPAILAHILTDEDNILILFHLLPEGKVYGLNHIYSCHSFNSFICLCESSLYVKLIISFLSGKPAASSFFISPSTNSIAFFFTSSSYCSFQMPFFSIYNLSLKSGSLSFHLSTSSFERYLDASSAVVWSAILYVKHSISVGPLPAFAFSRASFVALLTANTSLPSTCMPSKP